AIDRIMRVSVGFDLDRRGGGVRFRLLSNFREQSLEGFHSKTPAKCAEPFSGYPVVFEVFQQGKQQRHNLRLGHQVLEHEVEVVAQESAANEHGKLISA